MRVKQENRKENKEENKDHLIATWARKQTNKKLIHNLSDRNDLDMERIEIELDYNEDDNYGGCI